MAVKSVRGACRQALLDTQKVVDGLTAIADQVAAVRAALPEVSRTETPLAQEVEVLSGTRSTLAGIETHLRDIPGRVAQELGVQDWHDSHAKLATP